MSFKADNVQVVLFPYPGTADNEDAMQLWTRVFGDTPDGFQKAAASPILSSSASGERNGFQLSLTVQVGRIQLVIQAPAAAAQISPFSGPPRMDNPEKPIRRAAELLKAFAKAIRPSRVAIVTELGQTVDRGTQDSVLRKELEKLNLPHGVTDLGFQLNLRRPFNAYPSLEMNRLLAWQSGEVGFLPNAPGVSFSGPIPTIPFVGFKIDVNTPPNILLNQEEIDVIADELEEEALSLLAKGISGLF